MSKTSLIVSILFLVGMIGLVNAQQALPVGGRSFETAAQIEPGSYQGGSLDNKEAEYFYMTGVKSGQEINIEGVFTAANVEIGAWAILALYDDDGAELAVEEDGFYDEPLSLTISQLHRSKDSDKYYLMAKCDTWEIGSYTLEISLRGEGDEGIPTAGGEPSGEEGLNLSLILGIIAAIVIVGILIYFLFKKKKGRNFN
jgi:LPXTG-motif cell wall-anchored protein